METIRISPIRMKIVLSEEDRRRFAVTDEAFETDARGLLRRILGDTEEASVLEENGRLHLQVYDGRDGGCEIFLTCLSPEKVTVRPLRYLALWDTEALFMLCRRLKQGGYGGESRLFRLGERWYLDFGGAEPPLAALDFGETVRDEQASYISEYGRCAGIGIVDILG